MNLILLVYLLTASVLQVCRGQDYASYPPTYNPDPRQPSPTNDYYNPNSPKYDNPYDPRRKDQIRDQSQYDVSRNPYDPDPRYENRNDPTYQNKNDPYQNRNDPLYQKNDQTYQNPYNSIDNTPRPTWDNSKTYTSTYTGGALEHESVIINEA